MDKIYADLILAGRKIFDDVPFEIKEEVKKILHGYMIKGIITSKQYEELVG